VLVPSEKKKEKKLGNKPEGKTLDVKPPTNGMQGVPGCYLSNHHLVDNKSLEGTEIVKMGRNTREQDQRF